jgi:hypothetical protein
LVWGGASGLAGGIGLALLYRGLAIGVMGVVAPVTAVCAVTIPVVVGIAPGERPTMLAILGVHLAIVAIVLVSQSGHNEEGRGATTGLAIARGVSVSLFTIAGFAREKLLPRRESLPIVMGGGVLDIGSSWANASVSCNRREWPATHWPSCSSCRANVCTSPMVGLTQADKCTKLQLRPHTVHQGSMTWAFTEVTHEAS